MLVDAGGGRLSAAQAGPLSMATALAIGRRVIVLVPGIDVLFAQPELPVRGGARQLQVIPFALEEHIADDIEGMHFALGKPEPSRAGTPVAGVRRHRLEEWLAALRGAQIAPDAIYADSAMVPANPGQIVLMIDAERLYVRRPGEPPLVLDVQPLSEAFEFATLTTDSHVLLYVSQLGLAHSPAGHRRTTGTARKSQGAAATGWAVAAARAAGSYESALEPVARDVCAPFQGNRSVAGVAPARDPRWMLHCAESTRQRRRDRRLKSAEKALDASIEQVFREAMPGEQNAVDARRRMEARMTQLHGASGGQVANLPAIISVIAGAIAQVPETTVEAFSFRGTVLDMRIAARDVDSLDKLRRLVTDGGLQAELQSSNARDSGVEGRIQIKGPGAS